MSLHVKTTIILGKVEEDAENHPVHSNDLRIHKVL